MNKIRKELEIFNRNSEQKATIRRTPEGLQLLIDGSVITCGAVDVLIRLKQINHENAFDMM